MKKYFLILVISIVSSMSSFAQDTIILRNGDEVVAKVTEVSDNELRYLLWNNLDGPTYIKRVSDIYSVTYKSGHKDIFGNIDISNNEELEKEGERVNDEFFKMYSENGAMKMSGGILKKDYLQQILFTDEYETYTSARKQYCIGKGFVLSGVMVSSVGALLLIGESAVESNYTPSEKKALNAVSISAIVVGSILVNVGVPLWAVGAGRLHWVARNYNNRMSGNTVSLSVEPSLFQCPKELGNQSTAYGLGLTLDF